MAPDVGVTTGVCTLWQQEELVDYTIEVEDEQFKVHKLIVASVSDYFKAMLTGGMVESQTDRVRLEGLDPLAVSNMIAYIYTGEFGTKAARTEDLLGCAVYFQFPAAIAKCTELLYQEITDENCFDVLTIFKAYSLEDFVKRTISYMKSNIEHIRKICKPNDLSYNEFLLLVELWGKSEWDLFDSANLWISVDFENRVKHLNDLMSHIRYSLMTQKELEAVQNSYIFSAFKGSWCNLVCKAINYHNLPTHQRVLDDSEQSIVRGDPSPVCFSAEYDRDGEHYVGKSWTRHEADQTPDFNLPVIIVKVNNFLIVCDSSYTDKHWHIFDPRTRKWSAMGQLLISREAFALVHHEKHLYVLGGIVGGSQWSGIVVDSIERYDFESDTWCLVSSKLPVALKYHEACAIGSFIYVTGGSGRGYQSEQLHCFNPSRNTWENKAWMAEMESDFKVLVLNLLDEEVIFVIGEDLDMQYYTPSTNQWSEYEWKLFVDTKLTWTPGSKVLSDGNTLILLNFDRVVQQQEEPRRRGNVNKVFKPPLKVPGLCEKWIFEERGQKVTAVLLDQFPLLRRDRKDKEKDYFCAILSFSPASTKVE